MGIIYIAGTTYDVRAYIKDAGGQWQADKKAWAIDDAAWAKLVTNKPTLFRGCTALGVVADGAASGQFATQKQSTSDAARPLLSAPRKISAIGPCRKCQSYCYGDCDA